MDFFKDQVNVIEFVVGCVEKEVFGNFQIQVWGMGLSTKQVKHSFVDWR